MRPHPEPAPVLATPAAPAPWPPETGSVLLPSLAFRDAIVGTRDAVAPLRAVRHPFDTWVWFPRGDRGRPEDRCVWGPVVPADPAAGDDVSWPAHPALRLRGHWLALPEPQRAVRAKALARGIGMQRAFLSDLWHVGLDGELLAVLWTLMPHPAAAATSRRRRELPRRRRPV